MFVQSTNAGTFVLDFSVQSTKVMICLLQYFVESLTVVLPYYPTGTMERVVKEGQVRCCIHTCGEGGGQCCGCGPGGHQDAAFPEEEGTPR